MADVGNSRLNLSALQRLDNSITSVVESASQVCLYKFSPETDEWEKTSIEGSLFIYVRSKKPQYGFVVMNRINTTNLIEPVTNDFEFEVQKPFILYRNIQGEVLGIWFYQEDNLLRIAKLLFNLTQMTIKKKEKTTPKKGVPTMENKKCKNVTNDQNDFDNMDILSLLSRAQEEYDKKLSNQPKSPAKLNNKEYPIGQILKPTPVRATNGVVLSDNGAVSLSIDTLFAQVGHGKHVYNVDKESNNDKLQRSKSLTEAARSLKPETNENILQKLLLNNDGIMKMAHETSPDLYSNKKTSRSRSATISGSQNRHTSVEMVEMDLKEKLNLLPKRVETNEKEENVAADASNEQAYSYMPSQPKTILKSKENEISVLTPAMLSSSLPNSSSSPFDLGKNTYDSGNTSHSSSALPVPSLAKSHSPTVLLSPMDFQISAQHSSELPKCSSSSNIDTSYSASNNCFRTDESLKSDLLPPSAMMQNSMPTRNSSMTITPLTRSQLRDALIYMCEHDEDFINLMHENYLKRLKCQLNYDNS